MKNKVIAGLLVITIWLPMILFVYSNALGLPDTHPIWDVVVTLVGVGIFVMVPLATIRLLRAK